MKLPFSHIAPYLITALGLAALGWWVTKDPVKDFYTSEPGMDNRGQGVAVNLNINIGEFYERLDREVSDLTETWPRFRGEHFDNISRSDIALIDKFPAEGPDIKWSVRLGEGHAGPAIYKGKVYVLDYDEELRSDMLRCFSLESGKELWKRWYKVSIKRNHGMSRTIPAVTEDFILTIGPRSHVMCVDREDGNLLWGLNVEAEYLPEIPFWYTGQCPLIDEGKAIIATGGKALMIAVDCRTGEKLWETPNDKGWKMSHSSIMPFTFQGVKMYVYSAIGGACGIAAEGPDAGHILWETTQWNHPVVAPSPLCLPDGKIFLSAGYGAGSMVLQLIKDGPVFKAEVLQEYKPSGGLSSEQQTPLLFDGHVFGIPPKDAGQYRNQMICVHPDDFTKVVWSSGQTVRFGLGPYMISDNKLFILSDDGTLTIARPSVQQYTQLESYKIMDGHDAWGPLAIADGYLVLRDSENMLCIDIAKNRK
ncbi:MAG: PQQ-binding-like beta-propeller repeat protein [Bacteroidales bacterium]|nr:PQQ-binding-like beta-propeller repeat protein [Bacteroidales bacterium]